MHTESERLKFCRDYFEDGCSCLIIDKLFDKVGEEYSDLVATQFYEDNCVCSRNYADKTIMIDATEERIRLHNEEYMKLIKERKL